MITQILFPSHLAKNLGLRGGKLERLGRVVILAGPNGSGKSRYLRFVQEIFLLRDRTIGEYEAIFHATQHELTKLQVSANPEDHSERIAHYERQCSEAEGKSEALRHTRFSSVNGKSKATLVPLLYPKEGRGIRSARDMSPANLKTSAQATSLVGFDSAFSGMDAYCTQIAQALYHSEHPRMVNHEGFARQLQDARVFNDILRALLDGEIGFTLEDTEVLPTFRSRQFVTDELSTGERILLTWAISLHRQRKDLSNAIVLIDEPESHLHHDACIRALTKLRDEVLGPEGQIWLATHSVPLLAWGGMDSVHFVKDGAIEFAGNKVTSVVESLLGGKEGRERLATFLSDADEIAFMEFAAQCVLPAGIADPKTGDKQQAQFIEMLNQRLATHQSIRILDYSAGKGRFGSALRERLAAEDGSALQQRLEYFAYNHPRFTEPEVREACKARIVALTQPGAAGEYYWESMAQLSARYRQGINLVILCNVLHEIEPESWLTVFRDMDAVLAQDGALIIMEDLLPPVGELPNKRGYLLLDEFCLGLLFDDPKGVKVLQKREGRLLAVEIPKSLVSRVTDKTREAALRHLRNHAMEQVVNLRSQAEATPSHRLGREHAHFSMLYTNASLALESLR
ncbi:MAG TPA: AAA family ATPase [Archangium sp.]|uniref:AAA family ATPase n=1 Tax=Archangium sp. TaxID=1872627 RepID=UPI002E309F8E|nr:AAA family ATPase [Archangium sp.]HEX5747338.1 AAA family ATPase [Archangium sp.]